jgi:hypothetical protein
MTWEFWFTVGMALILIGAIIWAFVGIKKKEKPVRLSNYLFAYRITEGNPKGLPTEFLVNWKISNLENHLYLLYLTLEEDLYMEGYLHSVWVDYEGWNNVYIDVYEVEGIVDTKHTLIGKFWIEEGRMCCTPV